MTAAIVASVAVAACGSGPEQNVNEPNGYFPVEVSSATFPASQRLAENSNLVITVRNAGSQSIPNIAVTITDPPYGTAAQAFSTLIPPQPGLASRSRPVWVINQPPEPGSNPCGYSCQQGGPGGAATAYSNTWALGPLKPGQSDKFAWDVTAVQAGTYLVHYRVAAGLNGKAKAVLPGGGHQPVQGTFKVTISQKPRQAYVNNNGAIVYQR